MIVNNKSYSGDDKEHTIEFLLPEFDVTNMEISILAKNDHKFTNEIIHVFRNQTLAEIEQDKLEQERFEKEKTDRIVKEEEERILGEREEAEKIAKELEEIEKWQSKINEMQGGIKKPVEVCWNYIKPGLTKPVREDFP